MVLCKTGAILPSLISLVSSKICGTSEKHLRAEMQGDGSLKIAKTGALKKETKLAAKVIQTYFLWNSQLLQFTSF